MKTKYITTSAHPELKEGVILHHEEHDHDGEWFTETRLYSYADSQFKYALEHGHIKELQEPKWTDEDFIDILMSYRPYEAKQINSTEAKKILDDFKQMKNK